MQTIEYKLVEVYNEYISSKNITQMLNKVQLITLMRHSLNKALCLWAMINDTEVERLSDELSMRFSMCVSPKHMTVQERKALVGECIRILESEVSNIEHIKLS